MEFSRVWKGTALKTLACVVLNCLASAVWAQSGADCPVKQKLALDQVVGFIDRKVPEQRTLSLIESCHVSFSLNAAALDRLTAAGVSEAELDTLNRETLALLTVQQAHDEVAGLEQHIADSNKSIAAGRDAALQKLNAEYQIQREKAAHIEPRGEFETTQEFNARKQQAEAALAALDRKHDEDTTRLTDAYLAKANAKAHPFQARIAFLQNAEYPEAAKASYIEGAYNPDTQTLPITISGEEYLFDNVPPATARQIITNWKGVIIARPYVEDEEKTRELLLKQSQIAISGQSRLAKAAHLIEEARSCANRQDYVGAIDNYRSVLAFDQKNQIAKEGLEAMQQARQQQMEETQKRQLDAVGWVDPATHLMWMKKDNGQNIDWNSALAYCRAFRAGGVSDWRVPTIDELTSLHDSHATSVTAPTSSEWNGADRGRSSTVARGTTWTYHIKGGIVLSTGNVWTSSQNGSSNEAVIYSFVEGKLWQRYLDGTFQRALCVRSTGAAPESSSLPPVVLPKKSKHSDSSIEVFEQAIQACNAGNAESCELAGASYEKGFGVDKDKSMALPYYEKACSLGRSSGCFMARVLRDSLAKQK
jgi:TPR repeat protein